MTALHAARLFDGTAWHDDRVVVIEAERVSAVTKPGAAPAERLPVGWILVPGFVDAQVNGGGGLMFNDTLSVDGLGRIAAAHASVGSTTIVPTLISGTRSQLRAAMAAAAAAIREGVPGIPGIHIEGPFIALSRRGVHPAAAITALTEDDLALLGDTGFPGTRLVTLAPEVVPADAIRRLVAGGAVVFAGHTDASYEQAAAGLAAGISGFTHLFNAMSPLVGRAPGAVGAALADPACRAGIIADGLHVHPGSLRAVFAALGPDRLFLVSDAMATAASDTQGFILNGEPIRLRDGRLTNEAGTLAGAHLTMAEAVRNCVALAGIDLADALRMATATPAAALGLADRGRIAAGTLADFVALDEAMNVAAVWQGGRRL